MVFKPPVLRSVLRYLYPALLLVTRMPCPMVPQLLLVSLHGSSSGSVSSDTRRSYSSSAQWDKEEKKNKDPQHLTSCIIL